MQIKTITRYYFIPTLVANIKFDNGKISGLTSYVNESINYYKHLRK